MITKQELIKNKWLLHEWNGGSKCGGYDEYWRPLYYLHMGSLFEHRVSVAFNSYGDGKTHVYVHKGTNVVSFPNVTNLESLCTLWLFAGGSLENL